MGIANGGGGSYYSAANANELKAGLTKIKKEVVEKKEEAPKSLFAEEFDKPALSQKWTVINEDNDSKIIDSGACTIIPAVGEPGKETVKNLLLYKQAGPPGKL
jgi:hypothetical protein